MKYLLLLLACAATHGQILAPGIPALDAPLPTFTQTNQVNLSATTHGDKAALAINFATDTPWPNLFFKADTPWDWHDYAGIRVGLYNPEDTAVSVSLRVDNAGANGTDHCNTTQQLVPPGENATLTLYFSTTDRTRFWGMRGIPLRGPMGMGAPLDLSRITGWQLFLNRPAQPHTVLVTSVALFGEGGNLAEKVPFPFIDAYGQYKHLEWPGKIHNDAQLQEAHLREAALRAGQQPDGRDASGGWDGGPQMVGTGWFHTTKVNGKWWFVTPEGHLFFSTGMDCVGTGNRTFVEGRKAWFEWLPDEQDPPFNAAYGYAKNVHSMAESIGGSGKTFGFYEANLMRAYGDNWHEAWRENTIDRLQTWGFNTIGNWSEWKLMERGAMPFVIHLNLSGVRPIEAASGYWAKMMDVYDPSFGKAVTKAISKGTEPWQNNRQCLGYFVDNELAWEGVIKGVLKSDSEQPARLAFNAFLEGRYGDIAKLNTAWETTYANWTDVKEPESYTAAATTDLDAFLESFAATYYRRISEAFAKHAPNQLYLGSRFSSAPEPVVRACAQFADVVSFNIYAPGISPENDALFTSLNKPVLIGEFHFGATDRGMFHPGLVPVATQADRGTAYANYVKAMLRHPAVVGCHWFQYVDEPATGRTYDGENYNIGFVDVTDQPYPLLVEAATAVHRKMYPFRFSD